MKNGKVNLSEKSNFIKKSRYFVYYFVETVSNRHLKLKNGNWANIPIRGINKLAKGGDKMSDQKKITFQRLIKKVDQQEVAITQLLKIVAAINQRLNQEKKQVD